MTVNIRLKNIINKSESIRQTILKDKLLSESLNSKYIHIPKPYLGRGKIKLIIIGSDPGPCLEGPIIKTVMNLDRKGTIHYNYISGILKGLHLKFDNLYATNYYKCIFSKGDFRLKSAVQFKYWLELLKEEINNYPHAAIISSSELLNSFFITKGATKLVYYWDYIGANDSGLEFKYIEAKNNILNRNIYPFPHYRTYLQSVFYVHYLDNYLEWMRKIAF